MSFAAADHLEPWRTWGTTESFEVDLSQPFGGFSFGRLTANLINVENKIPTTWSLLLGVQILVPAGGIFVGNPNPKFIANLGLGRVNQRIEGLWWPILQNNPGVMVEAWASVFRGQVDISAGPNSIPAGTVPVSPAFDIHEIPCQSLQIQATIDFQGSGIATMAFTALAAPRTHIRPEWFQPESDPWSREI